MSAGVDASAFGPTLGAGGAFDATVGLDSSTVASGPLGGKGGTLVMDDGRGSSSETAATLARTTVLPTVTLRGATPTLVVERRMRYAHKALLGTGGMGEVSLSQDNDIGRTVAVKHLHREAMSPANLARFVEEIRTVGLLEHPNIVPIHDVGVGEDGRYFFVMKHIDGETLESVIEKLAARDPETLRKYSFEARVEVFLGVLHALQFAHAQGIVHRDLKPANVMIGKYGEVVLMDWGIAKRIGDTELEGETQGGRGESVSERERLFSTRHGSLIGTPAYMSPEQARGEIDKIGYQSDIYSACVMFHELVSVKHYMADQVTMAGMLAAITTESWGFFKVLGHHHPAHPQLPGELVHFLVKGLAHDPKDRYPTVEAMIDRLRDNLEGRIRVQCHITATKRTFREMGRLVDRQPNLAFFMLIGASALVLFALVMLVRIPLAR